MQQIDTEDKEVIAMNRSEQELETLDNMKFPKKLISLNLEMNKLEDLTRFPRTLKYLNASSNNIKSLVTLPHLPNLEELNLSRNSIELMTNLNTPKLAELNLSNNKIRLVEGLRACRHLKRINLKHNEVMKIKDIPPYNNIEELDLEGNCIVQLSQKDFSDLDKLILLNVSHNKLRDLQFVSMLYDLEVLLASKNKISDVKIEGAMHNLWKLDLSKNRIKSLSNFELYFPELTTVDLSFNKINNDHEFEFMIYLESLSEIHIKGNDFFTENGEDLFKEKYAFLEKINDKEYDRVTTREKKHIEELEDYVIVEKNLMTKDEIKNLYEKVENDFSDMDMDLSHLGDFEQKIKDEEFLKNLDELREYKKKYKDIFVELKRKADLSIRIVENELDYRKHHLVKDLKRFDIDIGEEIGDEEELKRKMLDIQRSIQIGMDEISEKSNESSSESGEEGMVESKEGKSGGAFKLLRKMSQKKERFRNSKEFSVTAGNTHSSFNSTKKRTLKTIPKRKKLPKMTKKMKESKSTDISFTSSTNFATPSQSNRQKSTTESKDLSAPGFRLNKLQSKTFNLNVVQHKKKKKYNYSYNVNLIKQQNEDIKKMLGLKKKKAGNKKGKD